MANPNEQLLIPTLRELYEKPDGAVVSSQLKALKREYTERYDLVHSFKKKEVKFSPYKENDSSYYLHFLIPSDMGANNYDVVLHLFDQTQSTSNMKNWSINVFSNCPSFIFTYATAYHVRGLMIPFLMKKLNREVQTQVPSQKNPELHLGWDKSLFYALHKLMTNTRFTQSFFLGRMAKPFNPAILLKEIRDQETIMAEAKAGKQRKFTAISINTGGSGIGNAISNAASAVKDAVTGSKSKKKEDKVISVTSTRKAHGGVRRIKAKPKIKGRKK